MKKWKKILLITSLLLMAASLLPVQLFSAAPITEAVTPSKEDFAAALASKIQLLKVRTAQLKKMNAIFHQVSGDALQANKKGDGLTKAKAQELLASYGLTEASDVAKPLDELKQNPHVKGHIEHLLAFLAKKDNQKLETEFNLLEKEILADLKIASTLGIDTATYKADMAEFAKTRFESLMWNAIYYGTKSKKASKKK